MSLINEKNIARAITSYIKENKKNEVLADLKFFSTQIKEVKEFKNLLLSKVNYNDKQKAIEKTFSSVSKESVKVLLLIVKHNYTKKINKIIELVENLIFEESGAQRAVVSSVIAINDNQKQQLETILSEKLNKTIQVENIINKEIKGGLKVRISDTLIDVSIAGKINQLKNKLS
jgi:F-type H+-transporting ATPase subunit delta